MVKSATLKAEKVWSKMFLSSQWSRWNREDKLISFIKQVRKVNAFSPDFSQLPVTFTADLWEWTLGKSQRGEREPAKGKWVGREHRNGKSLLAAQWFASVLTFPSDLFLLSTNGLGHWQILSPKTRKTPEIMSLFRRQVTEKVTGEPGTRRLLIRLWAPGKRWHKNTWCLEGRQTGR